MVVVVLLLALCSVLIASTVEEGKTEGRVPWSVHWKMVATIVASVMSVVAIIVAIVRRSRGRAPLVQVSPREFRESYFAPHITESILENLRSAKYPNFYVALAQIANCPVYDDEVITELGKIIGRQPPYDQASWLNSVQLCLLCRFLHLTLERNRASERGERFDSGANFDMIYRTSQSSYCTISGRRRWLVRGLFKVVAELCGVFSRRGENEE